MNRKAARQFAVGDHVLISNDIAKGNLSSSGLMMAVVRRHDEKFVDLELSGGTLTTIPTKIFSASVSV